MKILLDTNALLMPARFHVDLFGDLEGLVGTCEPVVLACVVRELEGLAMSRGKGGAAARFGLELTTRCTIVPEVAGPKLPVDEQVIQYAEKDRCVVLTNDRDLRNRLHEKGIGVISLKGLKNLELIQK